MIKLQKYYPNKPFFKMTINELQKHVNEQKYKWSRYKRRRKNRHTRKRVKKFKKSSTRKNMV